MLLRITFGVSDDFSGLDIFQRRIFCHEILFEHFQCMRCEAVSFSTEIGFIIGNNQIISEIHVFCRILCDCIHPAAPESKVKCSRRFAVDIKCAQFRTDLISAFRRHIKYSHNRGHETLLFQSCVHGFHLIGGDDFVRNAPICAHAVDSEMFHSLGVIRPGMEESIVNTHQNFEFLWCSGFRDSEHLARNGCFHCLLFIMVSPVINECFAFILHRLYQNTAMGVKPDRNRFAGYFKTMSGVFPAIPDYRSGPEEFHVFFYMRPIIAGISRHTNKIR